MYYYTNLSNKWRPQTFINVIGQKYIVLALINSLKQQKIYPCYLFSGSHGTGKTTLARILAKGLLCKVNINSKPCNKCINCINITNNNCIDLIEINGALHTKLEDIKELLESTQYLPNQSRFKIYLIDEVHMLSKYSFNALLKILEEPPLHVKFILATTDLNKIPDTIISRCLHLCLKPLNFKDLYFRLQYILNKDKIKFKKSILRIVVKLACGSMRDALTMLDYALLTSNNNELININIFQQYIGENYQFYALLLLKYLVHNNYKYLLKLIKKMYDLNLIDWFKIIDFMILIIHKIIMIKFSIDHQQYQYDYLENDSNISFNFLKLNFKDIAINKLIIYYQYLLETKKYFNLYNNNRIIIELNFLKIIIIMKNNNINNFFNKELLSYKNNDFYDKNSK